MRPSSILNGSLPPCRAYRLQPPPSREVKKMMWDVALSVGTISDPIRLITQVNIALLYCIGVVPPHYPPWPTGLKITTAFNSSWQGSLSSATCMCFTMCLQEYKVLYHRYDLHRYCTARTCVSIARLSCSPVYRADPVPCPCSVGLYSFYRRHLRHRRRPQFSG